MYPSVDPANCVGYVIATALGNSVQMLVVKPVNCNINYSKTCLVVPT